MQLDVEVLQLGVVDVVPRESKLLIEYVRFAIRNITLPVGFRDSVRPRKL